MTMDIMDFTKFPIGEKELKLLREIKEAKMKDKMKDKMICPKCKRPVDELLILKIQRKVGKEKENLAEVQMCDKCIRRGLKVEIH